MSCSTSRALRLLIGIAVAREMIGEKDEEGIEVNHCA